MEDKLDEEELQNHIVKDRYQVGTLLNIAKGFSIEKLNELFVHRWLEGLKPGDVTYLEQFEVVNQTIGRMKRQDNWSDEQDARFNQSSIELADKLSQVRRNQQISAHTMHMKELAFIDAMAPSEDKDRLMEQIREKIGA